MDLSPTVLIVGIVAMIVLMVLLPQIPVGWLGALLIAVFVSSLLPLAHA